MGSLRIRSSLEPPKRAWCSREEPVEGLVVSEAAEFPVLLPARRRNLEQVDFLHFLPDLLLMAASCGRKAALRLSDADSKKVLTSKCRCRPAGECLAGVKLEEVLHYRQSYWSLRTERDRLEWLSNARQKVPCSYSIAP